MEGKKGNPVLLEMTLLLVFFAVALAVAAELFGVVQALSLKSERLTDASLAAVSLCESGLVEAPGYIFSDGLFAYERELEGGLRAEVEVEKRDTTAGTLYQIEVDLFSDSGEGITSLRSARYLPGGGS